MEFWELLRKEKFSVPYNISTDLFDPLSDDQKNMMYMAACSALQSRAYFAAEFAWQIAMHPKAFLPTPAPSARYIRGSLSNFTCVELKQRLEQTYGILSKKLQQCVPPSLPAVQVKQYVEHYTGNRHIPQDNVVFFRSGKQITALIRDIRFFEHK